MSTYLWKYYFEDHVDKFRQLLENATYNASVVASKPSSGAAGGAPATTIGSPGKGLGTSPKLTSKSRRSPGWSPAAQPPGGKGPRPSGNITLTRADINWRDSHGVSLLHYIASSTSPTASLYALALLQLPLLDLYIQDAESGWTALHRALYFGNITVARAMMDRDRQDAIGETNFGVTHSTGGLIKIKDREGNSPFDVFGTSITNRIIRQGSTIPQIDGFFSEEEENDVAQGDSGDNMDDGSRTRVVTPRVSIGGDEMFAFGSNKNLTLGFGDEDDRQFPERILLTRADHLLRRLCAEFQFHRSEGKGYHLQQDLIESASATRSHALPAVVQHRPIIIQDVQLSKFHSAVLTTDPEANLYMCGFGSGGRLGTGDEVTRFHYVSVHGGGLMGKKVVHVGLGQNHTVAISSEGETFTWGSNLFGQLGYSLPASNGKDDEPMQLLPRQIFGPLKREVVIGATASRVHTVVHTASSLYTFGKNEGQLGIIDSDASSLIMQPIPRKVAASVFSSPISMVSAIDKATICLLDNHEVWIFANFGYTKLSFPLESFSNYFLRNSYLSTRYDSVQNQVSKITSGGDTICAISSRGDVFTVNVSQKAESGQTTTSTTNPSKIRRALSQPQRIWSLRKSHMAVRDVDVGQDGSVIICTESGSVWRRVKRAKIKDANASGATEYKPKDYKFSRVPGLTRITAVRSNIFGAYAAIRCDCDILKTQVSVDSSTLWTDLFPLLSFNELSADEEDSETENPTPRFWTPHKSKNDPATIRNAVLTTSDIEEKVTTLFAQQDKSKQSSYDVRLGTTISEARIPIHEFVLVGRSDMMGRALNEFRQNYFFSIPEIMTIEYDKEGKVLILFQGADFITIINLALYLYSDCVVDVWLHTRKVPKLAFRYRQIRTELMKIATTLNMRSLEQAVRVMVPPSKTLHRDLEHAIKQPDYFENGDVEVELDGHSMRVHSALMCQRCPFFEGLFNGRAAGLWVSSRRELAKDPQETIKVDLKHVNPDVFRLVLQHIYADVAEDIFEDAVRTDLDAFLDLIMDVMSVANELMLDRLVQSCQKILGQFGEQVCRVLKMMRLTHTVNTRNVCQLLNAVAPCSVTEFKDAALEYICLNLEGLLENHLLNELDDDLMLELDNVVRQNQLACLPFAKSGRAEAELHERYPELSGMIERSQCAKIDSLALQSRLHEDEVRFSASLKARVPSVDDLAPSPTIQKSRRRSKEHSGTLKSPILKPKSSEADLIFQMDEAYELDAHRACSDDESKLHVPSHEKSDKHHNTQPRTPLSSLPADDDVWFDRKGRALPSPPRVRTSHLTEEHRNQSIDSSSSLKGSSPSTSSQVWGPTAFTSDKLGMRDIMAQASLNRTSMISSNISTRDHDSEGAGGTIGAKLSQRERKKQQQQQPPERQHPIPASPSLEDQRIPDEKPASPWQVPAIGPKVSLKDVLGAESYGAPPAKALDLPTTSSIPPLTLRQTVPGKALAPHRSVSAGTQPQPTPPQRSASQPHPSKQFNLPPSPNKPNSPHVSAQPPTSKPSIHSLQHLPPPSAEPSLQLSMADILAQQQTEKDIIKEVAAKRSLQEIQEEQAFQEWWDQESRKVMLEVAGGASGAGGGEVRNRGSRGAGNRGKGRGRGRGRGRGGGVVGRGRGGAGS